MRSTSATIPVYFDCRAVSVSVVLLGSKEANWGDNCSILAIGIEKLTSLKAAISSRFGVVPSM